MNIKVNLFTYDTEIDTIYLKLRFQCSKLNADQRNLISLIVPNVHKVIKIGLTLPLRIDTQKDQSKFIHMDNAPAHTTVLTRQHLTSRGLCPTQITQQISPQ